MNKRERIATSVDTEMMPHRHTVVVGGAKRFIINLARCGVGRVTQVEFDRVSETNSFRQDYLGGVGLLKTDLVAADLRALDSNVEFIALNRDICSLNDEETKAHFGGADLLVASTDSFPAQARCNQIAVDLEIPFMSIGLYAEGRGGEIFYSVPGVTEACGRCAFKSRHTAFAAGAAQVSSQGGTILDLDLVDAITGQIAVGLLTRGAPNRFGRLIETLNGRNLIFIKIDPEFRLGEPDLFRPVSTGGSTGILCATAAFRVPRNPCCPDCARVSQVPESAREAVS